MKIRPLKAMLLACSLPLVAACSSSPSSSSDGTVPAPSSTADNDSIGVEIVDSGFGQGQYIGLAPVVVKSDDERSIGAFVTASVNFLDDQGAILATETQVESFSWLGQELVLPVTMSMSDHPGATISAIETSVSINSYGTVEPQPPLPVVVAESIEPTSYGGTKAVFNIENSTDSPIEGMRVGIVCYDANSNIVGGAFEFPPLLPAAQKIRLDSDLTTSSDAEVCRAFPNYPGY